MTFGTRSASVDWSGGLRLPSFNALQWVPRAGRAPATDRLPTHPGSPGWVFVACRSCASNPRLHAMRMAHAQGAYSGTREAGALGYAWVVGPSLWRAGLVRVERVDKQTHRRCSTWNVCGWRSSTGLAVSKHRSLECQPGTSTREGLPPQLHESTPTVTGVGTSEPLTAPSR
jgi:hypothetical protein